MLVFVLTTEPTGLNSEMCRCVFHSQMHLNSILGCAYYFVGPKIWHLLTNYIKQSTVFDSLCLQRLETSYVLNCQVLDQKVYMLTLVFSF